MKDVLPYRGSWQRTAGRLNAVQKSYKVFIFAGLILSVVISPVPDRILKNDLNVMSFMSFVREGIVPRLGRVLNQTKLVQISAASCVEREIDIGHIFDQGRNLARNGRSQPTPIRR